jgi:Tol biopolymer transport system component
MGPRGYEIAWSPSGRRLAFNYGDALGGDIYTVLADGSDRQQLTFFGEDFDFARSPSYSPGGGRIAFSFSRSETDKIATMRSNGSNRRVIATDDGTEAAGINNPIWSPGGEIAYLAHQRRHQRSSVWAMNPDGTGNRRLVTLGAHGGAGPIYSPDGDRFLFVRVWKDGSVHTLLADADGGNVRPSPCEVLSMGDTQPRRVGLFPLDYSPDGKWVLATRWYWNRTRPDLVRLSLGSCRHYTVVTGKFIEDADWQPLPDS